MGQARRLNRLAREVIALATRYQSEGIQAMSEAPKIAQKGPYPVKVTAGKSYFWCTCGRSAKQPFCDGSHKETSFEPMKYDAEADKTLFFCGCKATGNAPLCDGAHNKL